LGIFLKPLNDGEINVNDAVRLILLIFLVNTLINLQDTYLLLRQCC
jgi:hypothetical protein